jgi:hypothetical protein
MDTQLMTELFRVSGAASDAGILDWVKLMIIVPGALRLLAKVMTPPLRHAS